MPYLGYPFMRKQPVPGINWYDISMNLLSSFVIKILAWKRLYQSMLTTVEYFYCTSWSSGMCILTTACCIYAG